MSDSDRRSRDAELCFRPATELASLVRDRDVSAVELVEAHLRRIAAVNPLINAVVQLDAEQALDAARAADDALARGVAAGPLHGVPFTVKDNVETAGIVTAIGVVERASALPDTSPWHWPPRSSRRSAGSGRPRSDSWTPSALFTRRRRQHGAKAPGLRR